MSGRRGLGTGLGSRDYNNCMGVAWEKGCGMGERRGLRCNKEMNWEDLEVGVA